jgi:hypothetical protein
VVLPGLQSQSGFFQVLFYTGAFFALYNQNARPLRAFLVFYPRGRGRNVSVAYGAFYLNKKHFRKTRGCDIFGVLVFCHADFLFRLKLKTYTLHNPAVSATGADNGKKYYGFHEGNQPRQNFCYAGF